MELSYKLIGTDGKEYGPATLEQFRAWITEGRVTAETSVQRSDQTQWLPASSYSELQVGAAKAAVPASPTVAPVAAADAVLDRQIKAGSSWFFWIAGLSVVNSIAALSGSNWRFILGLGVTQLIDVFALQLGSGARIVAIVLDAIAAGIFILFGVFASRRQNWAFIVGMVAFALDGMLTLLFRDWISFGFHVFALFSIFRSYKVLRATR
jgi:hypothetical protein